MHHNRVFFGVFLFAVVCIGVIFILSRTQKNPPAQIKSFEDCVKAGYPVMESYPRQCTLPGGKFFVERVVPDTKGN